jgi:PAN domain
MAFSSTRSAFGSIPKACLGVLGAVRTRSQSLRRGLIGACWALLAFSAVTAIAARPAQAQANFDRPGGDYQSSRVASGDPADCALVCEHDRRCRAWSFNYPTEFAGGAVCWLKSNVPARTQSNCCVSGVRGAGVVELRNRSIETSIDRAGGDYRNFELKNSDADDACKAACVGDNKCRAWTYARPGYVGKDAHCFLKKDIKPPRRKAGFTSGVVR